MSDLTAQITDKLAALGDDPDAIAESLRAAGVKGSTDGGSCPLFVYLHREFPAVAWVSGSEVLSDDDDPVGFERIAAPLPDAAAEFVHRFDRGRYPDLYEEPMP